MLILQPRLSNFKTLVLGSCNQRDFDMDHCKISSKSIHFTKWNMYHGMYMYMYHVLFVRHGWEKNASAKNMGNMWKLFKPRHPLHFREIDAWFSSTAPYPQVPSLQRWPNIVAVPGVSVGGSTVGNTGETDNWWRHEETRWLLGGLGKLPPKQQSK